MTISVTLSHLINIKLDCKKEDQNFLQHNEALIIITIMKNMMIIITSIKMIKIIVSK